MTGELYNGGEDGDCKEENNEFFVLFDGRSEGKCHGRNNIFSFVKCYFSSIPTLFDIPVLLPVLTKRSRASFAWWREVLWVVYPTVSAGVSGNVNLRFEYYCSRHYKSHNFSIGSQPDRHDWLILNKSWYCGVFLPYYRWYHSLKKHADFFDLLIPFG